MQGKITNEDRLTEDEIARSTMNRTPVEFAATCVTAKPAATSAAPLTLLPVTWIFETDSEK